MGLQGDYIKVVFFLVHALFSSQVSKKAAKHEDGQPSWDIELKKCFLLSGKEMAHHMFDKNSVRMP